MVSWNIDKSSEVAIVSGVRTPWAKSGSVFRDVHVAELARAVLQESLYRAHWPAERVDEVVLGNVIMPPDSANIARVAALYAGIGANVPALTLQRNCGSGLEAVAEAAARIRIGEARAILAGGAESMSTLPMLLPDESRNPMMRLARSHGMMETAGAVATLRPRHFKPVAALELGLTDPTVNMIMGKTAEVLANEWHISRHEQDAFALRSHQRAVAAQQEGRFNSEVMPVYVPAPRGHESRLREFHVVNSDVGPRGNQTMEALAKLKPIFDRRDGTVTVGNSCQITDGAAAMLVMDGALARAEGLPVLGYVRAYAVAALDPARMGLGPVYAIDGVLKKTGMALADMELLEINEAFAAQVLACLSAMASAEFCGTHLDRSQPLGEIDQARLNVNGGAIALGHPVGATGARLVLALLLEMQRRDLHRGLVSLCVGGGQGVAMIVER